ncbi:DUF6695 family protein [Xanthomarina sp. GH4-25]|uniref:DUF6695 family protein n=1 Tax=Xanthomarina sp. GH4-25 TaxID=3349335 RepID=UPI000D680D57|nr:hypothetical protein DI383_05530 [Flavobacteriaceae bacterium LYZ1037]
MINSGIIITLAYPETVVRISDEWYLRYLHYLGIGKKNYVRAGHAALVLIDKETGVLEYYDFGRYITSQPNGRVRSKVTDSELEFHLVAKIKEAAIVNLHEILEYLATNPKLTHGKGTMYASVCNLVDYRLAKNYITNMQEKQFVRYAVFKNEASNCARFVTEVLIASVTNSSIVKRLRRSKWFTPSTIGNVVISASNKKVYQLSETGKFINNKVSVNRINRACFLDTLRQHVPNLEGNLYPKPFDHVKEFAQWLPGIGAGAWFELRESQIKQEFVFRRISAFGQVDVETIFKVENKSFKYNKDFEFLHHSNCKTLYIKQEDDIFKFNRILE